MSDNSNQPNYEEYWPYPTFSALGVDQGYIVEKKIVTAEELLVRFSGLEPFELAFGINDRIAADKLDRLCGFPEPFLLCKTRYDKFQDIMYHFLLKADALFPFRYTWIDDALSFDFTGIVFKEREIGNIEYCAVEYDFQLSPHEKAPKSYSRLPFLRENFPVDGPETLIEALMKEIAASPPVAKESRSSKKDMSRANAKRHEKVDTRWKSQFASGIAAAHFCLEQHQKTGKPVTRKEYEAALRKQGYASLMVEADALFRKLMPPEVLHRGD